MWFSKGLNPSPHGLTFSRPPSHIHNTSSNTHLWLNNFVVFNKRINTYSQSLTCLIEQVVNKIYLLCTQLLHWSAFPSILRPRGISLSHMKTHQLQATIANKFSLWSSGPCTLSLSFQLLFMYCHVLFHKFDSSGLGWPPLYFFRLSLQNAHVE